MLGIASTATVSGGSPSSLTLDSDSLTLHLPPDT